MSLGNGPSSEMANDLMRLAAEKSSEKRVELLRRVTEIYLGHVDASMTGEKYLFDELVGTIVNKIDADERAQAATHFSTLQQIPDSLAHRLATDRDIRVAEPIVRDYHALSERTLIEVAQSGSQNHLYAIASRSNVPERVTDIVVDRGDRRVVRTLAGNQGAQFSRAGMDKLIGKAEKDSTLQSLIVDRADLSLEAIGKLLPMISSELAARLQSKPMRLDGAAMQAHLQDWLEDRKKSIARTDAYIDGIRSGNLRLNDVTMELVRSRRIFDFVTVMSALLDLDRDATFAQLTNGAVAAARDRARLAAGRGLPQVAAHQVLRRAGARPRRARGLRVHRSWRCAACNPLHEGEKGGDGHSGSVRRRVAREAPTSRSPSIPASRDSAAARIPLRRRRRSGAPRARPHVPRPARCRWVG
jgi:hypothetical protein